MKATIRRSVRPIRPTLAVLVTCSVVGMAACAGVSGTPAGADSVRTGGVAWRTIQATNNFSTGVILYPELSGTTIWERIGRVPAHTSRTMRVPASYMERDFRVVVCPSGSRPGGASCTRTNRYLQNDPVPRLIIHPSSRLYAELVGED